MRERIKDILLSTRGQNWSMRQIMIINMGEFVLYRIETKIKAPSFLNIGDNDLNVCGTSMKYITNTIVLSC